MPSHNGAFSKNTNCRMVLSIFIIFATLIAELVGAMYSHSLALLSDAGHVFTDLCALVLSCVAYRLAAKKSDESRSYGYHRFQVVAAFVNGLSLIVIAAFIAFESVQRFIHPVSVYWQPMLTVSVVGLLSNIVVFMLMYRCQESNINIKSAVLHIIGDLLGSIAAIISSLLIMLKGWHIADPILSATVSMVMLGSALRIVKSSGNILLQGKPDQINIADVKDVILKDVPGVVKVHHVHLWSLATDYLVMTMHVQVSLETSESRAYAKTVVGKIRSLLNERFGIAHVTIEIEDEDVNCV